MNQWMCSAVRVLSYLLVAAGIWCGATMRPWWAALFFYAAILTTIPRWGQRWTYRSPPDNPEKP